MNRTEANHCRHVVGYDNPLDVDGSRLWRCVRCGYTIG